VELPSTNLGPSSVVLHPRASSAAGHRALAIGNPLVKHLHTKRKYILLETKKKFFLIRRLVRVHTKLKIILFYLVPAR